VRGTGRDPAACFTWKQVRLEFPSLASRLAEVQQRVLHVAPSWRSRADQVKDGRVDAMGCVRPCYPSFAVFDVLSPRGILVFCLSV
jgi:hypothetical protein